VKAYAVPIEPPVKGPPSNENHSLLRRAGRWEERMNLATRLPNDFSSLRHRLLPLTFAALAPFALAQPANINLPAPAQGKSAITALGLQLPDVAKAYGLEAQDLVTLFQTQPSLGVDTGGALLFACAGLSATEHGKLVEGRAKSDNGDKTEEVAGAMTPNSSVTSIATGSSVDAFKLHSLPGVSRVIFLDFNGHTTSGTSWNGYNGGSPIVSAPFDLDGDPSTFNDSERGLIQRIWQRVAEDYAPFGVDVTTEDPGLESLRKTTSSDSAFGMRVVISPTNWYNGGAGGVAYIGSFSYSSDTPCFAFTQQLVNGEKYIAEAVSHEVGHTLGLYHDGVSGVTEYYEGHADWAPIMGVGYYRSVVQFSKGEYASPTNTQDDLAVIATHVPIAGDDHGNTTATATTISGPNVATGGTIETRTDVDIFVLNAGAGEIALNLTGPAPDSNVNLKAELLNANGQVLQTSDSATDLRASIAATVSAGTYYLRVSGVGSGTSGSTGYSTYGSLGNYIITGTFSTSGVKQAPVAEATASATSGTTPVTITFSGANSTDSDGTIVSYTWNFGDGSSATGTTATKTFTTAGTYSVVLSVVDNDGLAGAASVTVNVSAPANVAPIASASANVTTGTAPVVVEFSSAGSMDPDGSIASYRWEFGDGTSSTAAAPSKTYMSPGNYSARLTVTDNQGATAASTVTIAVIGDGALDVDVYQLTVAPFTGKGGDSATASIVVLDRNSRPVAGATVSVQWSGLVSNSSMGKTDSAGRLMLTSQKTKKAGTITAAITTVTPPTGRAYDDSIFVEPLTKAVTLR
jgi:PKD repeat protein